ncbi:sugar-binding transcriptional regulator [Histidinibacterium lentulum]|uniref:Sugar-binding transcriptional regulator n=1 Tax=Histidinibacterium lentulum TaxID=2480588 RepID=A0A3N2R7M9_9RHOB|nr:sugar-binding transcriptional regulator [Histidinibacterium lentulum]ROU03464.1 sugar-binding transcriptional regulator [Histidinibacterium lentulum]
MAKDRSPDAETSLSLRAAWLHYVGGLRQAEVAKRLGVPSVKAHRLIQKAVAEGAVKVSIEGEIVACIELEEALRRRYGLDVCEVAPDLDEGGLPLRTLGRAGASFLRRLLELGEVTTIGISHGRTLAAMVQAMPNLSMPDRRFVSLMGGLTRSYAANPHDVMYMLAVKTGASSYVLPVPFFANSIEDRKVLLAQRGVSEVLEIARSAPVKVVGVGSAGSSAQLVVSGLIRPGEIEEISKSGGVGEMLGHFFDREGALVDTPLTARTVTVPLEKGRGDRIIAIAGGEEKVGPLQAILRSGHLSGLITDERTAQQLLAR